MNLIQFERSESGLKYKSYCNFKMKQISVHSFKIAEGLFTKWPSSSSSFSFLSPWQGEERAKGAGHREKKGGRAGRRGGGGRGRPAPTATTGRPCGGGVEGEGCDTPGVSFVLCREICP
jgi:hypothetical protein